MEQADDTHPLKKLAVPEAVREAVDRAISGRGACVSGYAQVEFILADFIVKVARVQGYAGLDAPFPMHFSSRAKRVREIADRPGTLHSDRDRLLNILDRIEPWEPLRHYLVHGWTDVLFDAGTGSIQIRMRQWHVKKGGAPELSEIRYTEDEITEAGDALSAIADATLQDFYDIYAAHQMERPRA